MTAGPRPFKCSAVISDVDGTLLTDEKTLTARTKAAGIFGDSVTGELKDLKMGDARFKIELAPRAPILRAPKTSAIWIGVLHPGVIGVVENSDAPRKVACQRSADRGLDALGGDGLEDLARLAES